MWREKMASENKTYVKICVDLSNSVCVVDFDVLSGGVWGCGGVVKWCEAVMLQCGGCGGGMWGSDDVV